MSVVVAFVCSVIIAILVKLIFEKKNQRLYDLLKQFPSYPTYPFIGNAHLLLGSFEGLLEKLTRNFQPYDRLVYWIGPIPVLLLTKYDDIATVLNQCQDRDTLEIANDFLGLGLLTARYKEWKTSRRILNPAFSSVMLSKYFQVFQKNGAILTENLKSVADTGEVVDVLHWMTKTSLDSIVALDGDPLNLFFEHGKFNGFTNQLIEILSKNSMGVSIEDSGKYGDNFCNAMHESTTTLAKRLQFPWLLQQRVFKLYLKITDKTKLVEYLRCLPTKMLRENVNEARYFPYGNDAAAPADDANSSRTITDTLVKKSLQETDFTEERMRDELLQMIAAGAETTALSLSFLLLMLALNQDVQQKVHEEIKQLSTDDDKITENDLLNHLPYLDQCVKETLRRFSPVVATVRRTHKDILLNDNKIIPANALILTFIYFANQDPQLYKNPSKWDPEHFSEHAVEQRPKASQLSFACGPRNCIGSRYAMMVIKVQIVHILRKYHLSTNIKELTTKDLYTDLSIRSKLGYPVKFTSRPEAKTLLTNI